MSIDWQAKLNMAEMQLMKTRDFIACFIACVEAGDEGHAGEDADEAGRNLAERDVQSTCGGWAAAKVWGWAAAFLG